jgi:cellobiose phosphorylase
VPRSWREYEITYRRGSASYHIRVENPRGLNHGVAEVEMDGQSLPGTSIPLTDDGQLHEVRVVLGERAVVKGAETLGEPETDSTPLPTA